MTIWPHIPTMAEVQAERAGKPILKAQQTRRQVNDAEVKQHTYGKAFKAAVRKRDGMRCRRCGRTVVVQMERTKARAEIHHIHGRVGALRFEVRSAILLCGSCHDEATGKVGGVKLLIHPTQTYELQTKGGIRILTNAGTTTIIPVKTERLQL